MKQIFKKILFFPIKLVTRKLKKLFPIYNLFYERLIYKWYAKQLYSLPDDEQIFFLTRRDFGTFLNMAHYIASWQELRGATCLVILTVEYDAVQTIIQHIKADFRVICYETPFFKWYIRFFGKKAIQNNTLAPTYAKLACAHPNHIVLFEQALYHSVIHKSNYIPSFDKNLLIPFLQQHSNFRAAYIAFRKLYDCRVSNYHDHIELFYKRDLSKPFFKNTAYRQSLLKDLGIDAPYVIMNINCKNLLSNFPKRIAEKRRIQHPERYSVLIDYLIEKEFTVILQGRDEQPKFAARDKFIDYSKSLHCSLKNDLELYSGCAFSIASKSGPENFCTLCNVPALGLNYTELTALSPNLKSRFFPKHIRNLVTGKLFTWQELLASPCFFDMGATSFLEEIDYEDLTEEEMIKAIDEFLPLLDAPLDGWEYYTEKQKAFRNALHPAHIDLYKVKSVPLDCYLVHATSP